MDKVIIKFEDTPCHHIIISSTTKFRTRCHFSFSSASNRSVTAPKQDQIKEKEREREEEEITSNHTQQKKNTRKPCPCGTHLSTNIVQYNSLLILNLIKEGRSHPPLRF